MQILPSGGHSTACEPGPKFSPVPTGECTSTFASLGFDWGIKEMYRQHILAADPGSQAEIAVPSISLACKSLFSGDQSSL